MALVAKCTSCPSRASASDIFTHRMYDISISARGRREGENAVTIRATVSSRRRGEERARGDLIERHERGDLLQSLEKRLIVRQPEVCVAVVQRQRREVTLSRVMQRPGLPLGPRELAGIERIVVHHDRN